MAAICISRPGNRNGPRVRALAKRACGLALVTMMPASAWAGPAPQPVTPYAQWEHGPPKDANFFPIAVWLQDPHNAKRFHGQARP